MFYIACFLLGGRMRDILFQSEEQRCDKDHVASVEGHTRGGCQVQATANRLYLPEDPNVCDQGRHQAFSADLGRAPSTERILFFCDPLAKFAKAQVVHKADFFAGGSYLPIRKFLSFTELTASQSSDYLKNSPLSDVIVFRFHFRHAAERRLLDQFGLQFLQLAELHSQRLQVAAMVIGHLGSRL
jgi:hypothetical protein